MIKRNWNVCQRARNCFVELGRGCPVMVSVGGEPTSWQAPRPAVPVEGLQLEFDWRKSPQKTGVTQNDRFASP
jgi:hypothetical protein